MKRILTIILAVSAFFNTAFAQTTTSVSIRKVTAGGTSVEVVVKPSADINAQVGNINITFSIPDQTLTGGTNPSEASITKLTTINNVTLAPTDANNPYIIGNRAYYSYLILPTNGGIDVPTAFSSATDNVVATFTFLTNTFFSGMQLNDLTSSGGGPNAQMVWYIQFNQGVGDVTNYTTPFYGVGANNNGGASEQFVTLQPPGTVPVKFLGFTATKKNNTALLSWRVENEDATTAKYVIQKSANAVNFDDVAEVPAKNNGSNIYSFIQDNLSAIRNSGVIYFRIKQSDKDGKFVYTPIRSVRIDGKSFSVSSYPNPVKDYTKIIIDLIKESNVNVTVTDASGKLVRNINIQGVKGPNFKDINMNNLASGSYMLKVQADKEIKTISLVKVNN